MRRTASLLLPAALLLLGGVFLAILGLRLVEGERGAISERERARAVRAVEAVVEPVVARAGSPTSAPDEAWEILAAPAPAPALPSEGYASLLAAQAEHLERTTGNAEDAAALYARIVETEERGWATVAALRAGSLHLRAGQTDDAIRLLEIAAQAPPEQRDEVERLPIRLLALYLLATAEPDSRERAFLEAAGAGHVVSTVDHPGPDDLILALAARGTPVSDVLAEAAARARRGQGALAALPGPGLTTAHDGRVLRRGDGRLEARRASELLRGIAVTGVASLVLEERSRPPADGQLSVPLPPPLQALALRGVAPSSPSHPPLAGFVAALVVYVLASGLALLGVYRALRAAQAQADFLAEVSHELKTPIASVRAMAEFLADGPADDEVKVRDYARRIEGEMGRLGTTVRNVLDAARIERQGRLPVTLRRGDPSAVIATTVAAVGPGLEARGFTLHTRSAPAGDVVLLDEAALQSAVTNLVDNAAKFSPDAREIEIDAGPVDGRYRIEVRDRGRGIDGTDVDRLFRRFERGAAVRKDAVPGVGLGLHVVQEIVEAHEGTVMGRPREGGGAIFTLDLPLVGDGESRT